WPGKTVTCAVGQYTYQSKIVSIVDLPGCYSLEAQSAEEDVAREFILSGVADAVVVVCDATNMERSLRFVLQILELTERVVVCVNLMDEAEKKGISVRIKQLECMLGVPVVATAARGKRGYGKLKERITECVSLPPLHRIPAENEEERMLRAERIARAVVRRKELREDTCDRSIDRVIAGKWGFAVMGLLLLLVFWLTIAGSNVPSRYLSEWFSVGEKYLYQALSFFKVPIVLCDMAVYGVYRMVARVVSVMLPPMAIFFPLFTLLEDVGYLPRMAFVLDKCFQTCNACGKQALTMCMGFGCNAAGVVGARIMESPGERLIAILTNSFMPCNGRFPTLILLISMFLIAGGSSFLCAVILFFVVLLGVLITFLVSKVLSQTVLKAVPSSFVLELPPYRRPQIAKILVRSVFDRTLFVLGRAVAVAAPAGLLLWLMANVGIGGATVLQQFAAFLDPVGKALGMDGVILMAFILGCPANETVIPIMLMAYLSQGTMTEWTDASMLKQVLLENGWTVLTAVNVMLFSLCHWPCSTTLLTVKKETGSWGWTVAAAGIPTAVGVVLCLFTTAVFHLFH
ncbi:MAG: ferrous iron transporter B, partial [Clostridia bacterium]|nr:ferrous iron transporter B [Clostridia bacterium]